MKEYGKKGIACQIEYALIDHIEEVISKKPLSYTYFRLFGAN
jgi:hypothetical protein